MFGDREKEIWGRLEMPYIPVAVKFSRNKPEGYEICEEEDMLCAFLHKAQTNHKAYCIDVDHENCMGKVVTGLGEFEPNHASGNVGAELGCYRTQAANARLYYEAPMLKQGTVNYIIFCPLDMVDFTPDLIICVADPESAHVILRAGSYRSGDLWESKWSFVMSCAWTYVYPYLSGKINTLQTGMTLGLRFAGLYPQGLSIIAIPYQKIDEVTESLNEMKWVIEKPAPEFDEHLGQLAADPAKPIKLR